MKLKVGPQHRLTKVSVLTLFITIVNANQGNSLFELSSKRKLARMRQSNPILSMEDKKEELYTIQSAVDQLGGISDTLSGLQDSLLQNEIANIQRSIKWVT